LQAILPARSWATSRIACKQAPASDPKAHFQSHFELSPHPTMSFKSYALHRQPDGILVLDDPQPLIFSGPHGLIARFVRSDPRRAGEPWRLCPGELHALAFPDTLIRDRAIFFEQVAEGKLELQWLQSVQGISGARTEMMFSFSPVTTVRAAAPIAIRPPAADRVYHEGLELEGGVLSPNGSWHWGRPHLALGGVVLQPAGGAKTLVASR
jgi:hypothetical protein